MNAFQRFAQQLTVRQMTLLAIALCFPAFLINLGTIAFIGDEAIRALISFEMDKSGNFLVPTLNGEEYYNKPPLYNWIIYLVSKLFGFFGEWPSRITTLIFLGVYGFVVYHFTRKYFDQLTAVTMAFMLLTSGRILFGDSMLGLLDICFSMIIFLSFMVLYVYGEKNNWRSFFLVSYVLFAIGFLLKGFPAVVFQAISIVVALLLHGSFRKRILSAHHFMGMGVALLILLAYYIPYAQQVPIDKVFSVLVDQSLQRTATHYGIGRTIQHLITFPFEFFYHFLPWTLVMITLFHPRFRTWLNQHPFIRFNFWIFMANIPVYWVSVQVYPRYLLMFLPLIHIVGYYGLQQIARDSTWWKIIQFGFIVLAAIFTLGAILMPLHAQVREINGIWIIWIISAAALVIVFFCMLADIQRIFLWFSIVLLVTRCVFDLVVLPVRSWSYHENLCREDCRRIANKHGEHTWYILRDTETHQVARFYTSSYSNQVVRKTPVVRDSSAYYLIGRSIYPVNDGQVVDSLLLETLQVIDLKQYPARR